MLAQDTRLDPRVCSCLAGNVGLVSGLAWSGWAGVGWCVIVVVSVGLAALLVWVAALAAVVCMVLRVLSGGWFG